MADTTPRRRPRFGLCIVTWLAMAVLIYAIAFSQFLALDAVDDQKSEFKHVGYNYPNLRYGWPLPFVDAKPFRLGFIIPLRGHDVLEFPLYKGQSPLIWSWSRPWPWEWEDADLNRCALSLDILTWLAILVSTVILCEMRCRRSSGRWQVCLRGLLISFAAAAFLLPVIQKTGLHEWLDLQSPFISYSYCRIPIGLMSTHRYDLWEGNMWMWRLNVALVALILCIGLTCTIYAAGMLLIRLVHNVPRVVIARLAKKQIASQLVKP